MKDALLRDTNNMELNEKPNGAGEGRKKKNQQSETKAPWNSKSLLWASFLCVGLLFEGLSCCASAQLGSRSSFHCESRDLRPGSGNALKAGGGSCSPAGGARQVVRSLRSRHSLQRALPPDAVNEPINLTSCPTMALASLSATLMGTRAPKIVKFPTPNKGLLFPAMILFFPLFFSHCQEK